MPRNPATATTSTHRAAREQTFVLVVLSLLVALAAGGAILGAMRVSESIRLRRSRDGLQASLSHVFERQGAFRRSNARFATWEEMVADGVRLPSGQRVRKSNADRSHWFLSLHDERTGVVCDRVGEIFDEPDDRPSRCRDGADGSAIADE